MHLSWSDVVSLGGWGGDIKLGSLVLLDLISVDPIQGTDVKEFTALLEQSRVEERSPATVVWPPY